MTARITLLTAILVALAYSTAAHDGHDEGPHDSVFKIGKTGEVKIGKDVKIGPVLVRQGKYVAVHRMDGDSHVLVLSAPAPAGSDGAVIHELRMRWIGSKEPVKASAIVAEELKDRSYRVKTVRFAGEAGDHLPELGLAAE